MIFHLQLVLLVLLQQLTQELTMLEKVVNRSI